MTEEPSIVEIRVHADSINRYTTLFQMGVNIETQGNTSIGSFLNRLPGFTTEYIDNRVQTIFLNGSAIDDLQTPLTGTHPVLAISAAMPGLAGAIFRRNSLHAALRSDCADNLVPIGHDETVTVTLKLFNMIAREKGTDLLAQGVGCTGAQMAHFFTDNPMLVSTITQSFLAGREVAREDLMKYLDRLDAIRLIIKKDTI
jgi:hypothetical protein